MHVLVLQHISIEHPGMFRDLWAEGGHTWSAVEIDAGESIPAFDGFDLMVAMGGPMDVWQEREHPWLIPEKAAIRRWVKDLERPFLGICLGHQLLADALGGKVTKMARPEVGVVNIDLTPNGLTDRLLAGCQDRFEALQWHGAEISVLPPGGRALATNAASQFQAICWGKYAYGFQYHIEITATTASEWSAVPEYKAALDRTLGAGGAARLERHVADSLPKFWASVRHMNQNLTEIVASASQSLVRTRS